MLASDHASLEKSVHFSDNVVKDAVTCGSWDDGKPSVTVVARVDNEDLLPFVFHACLYLEPMLDEIDAMRKRVEAAEESQRVAWEYAKGVTEMAADAMRKKRR